MPSWDFDLMTSILAVLLRRKPNLNQPAPPPIPSVNATEQRGRPTCPCCGQQGHVAKECPTVCTVCSEKACPGNAGGACIVCTSADIPAVVKDATKLGRTIPDWCHERLVEAQKKWRAKTAADKTAKEASNVEAPFGSSRVTFWNSPYAELEWTVRGFRAGGAAAAFPAQAGAVCAGFGGGEVHQVVAVVGRPHGGRHGLGLIQRG